MVWYPEVPELADWLDLYQRVARGNGGEPDAGRRMHAWAREAGLSQLIVSSSTWTFATPEQRAWWGGLWADRTVRSSYAERAIGGGYATAEDLRKIADGWRAWAAHQDAWFAVVNGEMLCHIESSLEAARQEPAYAAAYGQIRGRLPPQSRRPRGLLGRGRPAIDWYADRRPSWTTATRRSTAGSPTAR